MAFTSTNGVIDSINSLLLLGSASSSSSSPSSSGSGSTGTAESSDGEVEQVLSFGRLSSIGQLASLEVERKLFELIAAAASSSESKSDEEAIRRWFIKSSFISHSVFDARGTSALNAREIAWIHICRSSAAAAAGSEGTNGSKGSRCGGQIQLRMIRLLRHPKSMQRFITSHYAKRIALGLASWAQSNQYVREHVEPELYTALTPSAGSGGSTSVEYVEAASSSIYWLNVIGASCIRRMTAFQYMDAREEATRDTIRTALERYLTHTSHNDNIIPFAIPVIQGAQLMADHLSSQIRFKNGFQSLDFNAGVKELYSVAGETTAFGNTYDVAIRSMLVPRQDDPDQEWHKIGDDIPEKDIWYMVTWSYLVSQCTASSSSSSSAAAATSKGGSTGMIFADSLYFMDQYVIHWRSIGTDRFYRLFYNFIGADTQPGLVSSRFCHHPFILHAGERLWMVCDTDGAMIACNSSIDAIICLWRLVRTMINGVALPPIDQLVETANASM